MKKHKISIISNAIIFSMLVVLSVVTLLPNKFVAVSSASNSPIYHGNTDKKQVSFMINVYWGTEFIEQIMKIFDKYNAKTTFFVGGSWVEKNNNLLKLMDEKGHEIANHGYLHKDHKKLDYKGNFDEISLTNKLIKNVIGKDVKLFAPPSGSFSKTTLEVASKLEMQTIMWSKDTIDWRDKDSNLVFTRATKNLACGDLILAHPTKHTVEALDKILQFYIEKGYSIVTVSQNIMSTVL